MLKVMDTVKNGQKQAATIMAAPADRVAPRPFSMHFEMPDDLAR